MARYIDADIVLAKLKDFSNDYYCINAIERAFGVDDAMFIIKDAPTADVEKVRHGKWIKKNNVNYSPFDGSPEYIYICSECGREENKQEPYCNCGAKMDGGKK